MTFKTQGIALVLALTFLLSAPFAGHAQSLPPLEQMMQEQTVGDPNAPVEVIEYASLGCSHCRAFHEDTYPRVVENYVNTGKVKFVFRDFPLGTPAMAASMIARCSGPARYKGAVEVFFRDQQDWSRPQDGDIVGALKRSAQKLGMSGTQVEACLGNQELLTALRQNAVTAQQNHGIDSTPSFLINGRKASGNLPYDDFAKMIEEALN